MCIKTKQIRCNEQPFTTHSQLNVDGIIDTDKFCGNFKMALCYQRRTLLTYNVFGPLVVS